MENAKNILNEILLKMKYDSSKTLSENKVILEQLSQSDFSGMPVNPNNNQQNKTNPTLKGSIGDWSNNEYKKSVLADLFTKQNNLGGNETTINGTPAWAINFNDYWIYYTINNQGTKRYFKYNKDVTNIIEKGNWDIVSGKLTYRNDNVTQKNSNKPVTKRKYKPLNDNFVIYSYNKEHIGKLQDCLGMKIKESEKGFFGPKTLATLKNTSQFSAKASKNEPITVAEIIAFCGGNQPQTLKSQGIKELPTQEPEKAQPATTQQNAQQPQQELTGRARRKADRARKKSTQPEG